jgi:alpha-glucosidase (family GH31 glycosyl hydrolase)
MGQKQYEESCGHSLPQSVIEGGHYRFTVLTGQLVRMEYDEDGVFEDRQTQMAINRDFPTPEYYVWKTGVGIEIKTEYISIFYNEKTFSPHGLTVENHSECRGIYCTWHFGDPLGDNLGGTARTLDEADGAVPLEPGILSRLQGFSVIDDSKSLVLTSDGWVEPRKNSIQDIYFFSYGYDYKQALRDFFHLCGPAPLLPRFALGNWWSRFYAYKDTEYLELMDTFQKHGIPLSVSVLDMDWHITKPADGGKGWTGYTWNKELFPDPEGFLQNLHSRGLKTTLNLHPADGVASHEEMYADMAQALGKDTSRRQRIPFDAGSRTFLEAYFKYLHHPHEKEGVDFWWVDWQQGTSSTVPGLDPLWILNHYHTLDIARGGKRPLILSRYAGPGSHRYPAGFSGDSVISWDSLKFQPYFTATASNIGYGWWSHDIGGHTHGRYDEELQVRWLQYGVFSPIMRMHSTCNLFNGKEPWRYGPESCAIMTKFLRYRHKLLPYLYTMNWRSHTQGEPLVQPMYYFHPRHEEAYHVPTQYYFGSELIVCPITEPMDRTLMQSCVKAWLPEGLYIDIFNGLKYHGGRMIKLFRPLAEIPVLAKAGAILPMTAVKECLSNGTHLPKSLDIQVYAGADGVFEMYEDDGETMEYTLGEQSVTSFSFRWQTGGRTEFIISPGTVKKFMPEKRTYTVSFVGVEANTSLTVCINGGENITVQPVYESESHTLRVALYDIPCGTGAKLVFEQPLHLAANETAKRFELILCGAQIEYELKDQIYRILTGIHDERLVISNLQALQIPQNVLGAILEVLLA